MESYLMMLYVTLEQESALKNFFVEHGWAFCKPDLSVVTDKLGPVTARLSLTSEEIDVSDTHPQKEQETQKLKESIPASSENTVKQRGKRKTCSQRQPIKLPKQAKVVPSTSVTDANESDESEETPEPGEISEFHDVEEQKQENTHDTNPTTGKITVEMGDGRQIQIKIERERLDMVESEGVLEKQDKGEQVGGMINDAEEENSDGDDAQTDGENAGDRIVKSEYETAGNSSNSRMELSVDDAAPKNCIPTQLTTICQICNKSYTSKYSLKYHLKYVHGGVLKPKYKCGMCSSQFGNKWNRSRHVETVHRNVRNFECDTCGKKFGAKGSLERHLVHYHNTCLKYRCAFCQKVYVTEDSCLWHESTCVLTVQARLTCNICSKTFKTRELVLRHMKETHACPDSIKYVCHICGLSYNRKSNLNRHVKMHYSIKTGD